MTGAPTNEVAVFVGPSCPAAIVRQHLDALVLGPAKRGDLLKAAEGGANTIVLIDGVLVYGYPPSPTEILDVLRRGVRVYGAASLGALRAVELRVHGMVGMGWVYDAYLRRIIDADDEVVVPFSPETNKPLAIPLVRVRYAVDELVREGVMEATVGTEMIRRLREVYFEERTAAWVGEVARDCGIDPPVVSQLLSDEHDIKRKDTAACLAAVRRILATRAAPTS